MSYEEWIECINILKNSNNEDIKNKLLDEYNDNLKDMLIPKLIDLIKYKFNLSVQNILNNLDNIFSDNNILDMSLVRFRKEVLFIYSLTDIKEFTENNKNGLKDMVKRESKEVYDILIKESNKVDPTGILNMTIKNNVIKWSDDNEL
ncbi:MAG: hypothetical protein IJF92_01730 [Bacilli bacterium]|nr:hypothetical protein [Bacilli bacterium]